MTGHLVAVTYSKDYYSHSPTGRGGLPEGGEGGEGGDAGALGLGAAGHAEAGERGQQREGRQVGAAPDALAVLQLQRGQARQRAQRLQPAADRALLTLFRVDSCPVPGRCCDDINLTKYSLLTKCPG